MKMLTIVVDIPDQGLATRFGVTMPVGETEFHMDKIPGGAPLTLRLLEFTSRDYSEYRVLGDGKYDPFLMATLGVDYWDKFCIMASLGVFKEGEND